MCWAAAAPMEDDNNRGGELLESEGLSHPPIVHRMQEWGSYILRMLTTILPPLGWVDRLPSISLHSFAG